MNKKDIFRISEKIAKTYLDSLVYNPFETEYKGIIIYSFTSGNYGIEKFNKVFASKELAKDFIDSLELGSVLYE